MYPASAPLRQIIAEMASNLREDTAYHEAAYTGQVNRLSDLKDQEKKFKSSLLDQKNPLGCTPIRLAASVGHVACLIWLIKEGADVNISDIKGQSPLLVAVKKHHVDCIRTLLEAGAHVEGDPHNICSPLYMSAMDGFYEGMELLINFGADLNGVSTERSMDLQGTPLSITIAYQHWECFKLLLLSGVEMNNTMPNRRKLPYHQAVKYNVGDKYISLLFECGVSLYAQDDSGLMASQLSIENETKNHLKIYYESPQLLRSTCRLAIRNALGRGRLSCITHLPLPRSLITYLKHES